MLEWKYNKESWESNIKLLKGLLEIGKIDNLMLGSKGISIIIEKEEYNNLKWFISEGSNIELTDEKGYIRFNMEMESMGVEYEEVSNIVRIVLNGKEEEYIMFEMWKKESE